MKKSQPASPGPGPCFFLLFSHARVSGYCESTGCPFVSFECEIFAGSLLGYLPSSIHLLETSLHVIHVSPKKEMLSSPTVLPSLLP